MWVQCGMRSSYDEAVQVSKGWYMVVPREIPNNPVHSTVGVIVVAAGESQRMLGVDKIFVPLMGLPLICYSLRVIHDSIRVKDIVLVLSRSNIEMGHQLVKANKWDKIKHICVGGERRQDSVSRGIERLPDVDWIIVHDGARPFIKGDLITRGLKEAEHTGAAVAAVPVKDTIKSADKESFVTHTYFRDSLWAIQTPQVFRRKIIEEAHLNVSEEVSDDASMVERCGGKVRIFMGSYGNIKITTPEDMSIAETMLEARASREYQERQ